MKVNRSDIIECIAHMPLTPPEMIRNKEGVMDYDTLRFHIKAIDARLEDAEEFYKHGMTNYYTRMLHEAKCHLSDATAGFASLLAEDVEKEQ